jgi:hypothetical protein
MSSMSEAMGLRSGYEEELSDLKDICTGTAGSKEPWFCAWPKRRHPPLPLPLPDSFPGM